jgi:hypothetical protein
MVDPAFLPNIGPAQGVSRDTTAKPTTKTPETGAAFKALLEQLAERARELEKTSTKPVDASGLAGAVEEAHGSLQDALTLSSQLIEAYRANVQTGAKPATAGKPPVSPGC